MSDVLKIIGGGIIVLIGWAMVAFGQVFLAVREIALNTRKEDSSFKTDYSALMALTKLNNFIGWIAVFAGFILMFAQT